MITNTYNLCEDWGWYVDIESTNHQIELKTVTTYNKGTYRKFSLHLNRLDPILENKKYYDRNYDEIYDKFDKIEDKIEDSKLCKHPNFVYFVYKNLFGIGSTTIITLSISYVIFFMI